MAPPTDPEVAKRRPADMRCRALVGTSTKDDAVVEHCQEPTVYVLPNGNGRTVKEDPGNAAGRWTIYCDTHYKTMLRNRTNDLRDEDGHRAYGPQCILKGQTADPWVDPVEGGKRGASV